MLLLRCIESAENTGESESNVKRGLKLGNMAVSYTESELPSDDGNTVKTVTVFRKMGAVDDDDDEVPNNIIRHPNGAISQFWPADMRNDVLQNIKSTPPVFPIESTGFGYYTSYTTKHKETGPLTFPPAPPPEKPGPGTKVSSKMKTIAKLPSITKPKPVKFTHWDGQKFASGQENLYREGPESTVPYGFEFGFGPPPQQQFYVEATANPYRDYSNFFRDCYHLNPGQFRFHVLDPSPDMLAIAEALSNGDLRQVKALAARIPDSQNNINYTITFPIVPANQREVFPAPTDFTRPTFGGTNFGNNVTAASTKRPSVYIAPTKMRYVRKRLNRRPKPASRNTINQATSTSTTTEIIQLPTMVSTEAATMPPTTIPATTMPQTTQNDWAPMTQPAAISQPVAMPQRRHVARKRLRYTRISHE